MSWRRMPPAVFWASIEPVRFYGPDGNLISWSERKHV